MERKIDFLFCFQFFTSIITICIVVSILIIEIHYMKNSTSSKIDDISMKLEVLSSKNDILYEKMLYNTEKIKEINHMIENIDIQNGFE